jgi:hypothetical protein
MKQMQLIACTALALALTALFGASIASATTLEVKGVKKNESLAFKFTLKAGTSMLMTDTVRNFVNTCTASTKEGKSEGSFTGTRVGGNLASLSFSSCVEGPIVIDTSGTLNVENIAGTTNGTVRSVGTKVTVPSPFGALTCVTASGEGTDIGVLTGVVSGQATIHMNAAINCGFITAKWLATYTATSPEGLGVAS